MERDMEWEKISYLWHHLPFLSRINIVLTGIKFHVALRIVEMSRFKWALLIEGVIITTLIVLATTFHDNFFSVVAWVAIGIIIGGTFIFWVFKDIPREQ